MWTQTNGSGGSDHSADRGYWPLAITLRRLITAARHREIQVIVLLNT